ncbi:alpha/beta fold hydrolase [Alkalihalobacillus pseudalcaliphilus]|uniref:alpha/beta fold hydrolase n=1 Tax=Alkalihalobacillus pseudalcaliphilus TaxID=79884 RepID=UPI00064D8382|nr:alpha/beta hydrolase [Alkalihalobacillus pseudalcaliphilus]KMK75553.1 hypothetical protein AB990_09660 [Alkalihalobacillus pseudalcaliphilus]
MSYILIHGLGQNPSSWQTVIEASQLPTHTYCPDLFQLLGETDPSYENLYEKFKEDLDKKEGRIHLCGLSLGAILSLHYTIERPEKVQSLILIGAQYKMPKLILSMQNFVFQFMPNQTFSKLGINKKSFISLTNSLKELDFTQQLEKITCPTLIVCGEKDLANKPAFKHLSQTIQQAQAIMVKDAGHEINQDHPHELAKVIDGFWHTTDY